MTALELLGSLHQLGVRMRLDNGRLRMTAPKGVLTAELRGQVTARRDEIVALLAELGGAAEPAPPVTPQPRPAGGSPLSFAQQRLWFLQRLDPAEIAYNVPAALRLSGRLDAVALGAALALVVARHEVLRTRFVAVDGVPVQVVEPAGAPPLPLVEVPAGTADPVAEAYRMAAELAATPFDLAAAPPLRAMLVRVAADDHVLALAMHHIVCDEWSVEVFTAELTEAYRALRAGEQPRLPDLPVQYADYAMWQRRWLSGEVLDRQLAYWRDRLAGLEPLDLPPDRVAPLAAVPAGIAPAGIAPPGIAPPGVVPAGVVADRPSRAGLVPFAVPQDTAQVLQRLAADRDATLFMVVLAAFDVLLGRWAGRDDVAVGTPVAGRSRGEVENLIGFFVNTLVLRTDLSGDPTVAGLVDRVRDGLLGAYTHADVPFERLVEELAPDRDSTRNPLFSVMFSFEQGGGGGGLDLAGIDSCDLGVTHGATPFDLTMNVSATGDRLTGVIEYRAGLFTPQTAERFAACFVRLLHQVAERPDRPVSTLTLLGADERAALLRAASGPVEPYPRVPVPDRIAAHAAAHPGDLALVHGDGRLTFGDLLLRADGLARRLRGHGVRPGDVVGVCLPRGIGYVVAMLAVWRAGAAYLPLDPEYPAERTALMVADAGATTVVAVPATGALLPAGTRLVHPDDAAEPGQVSALPAVPLDAPAYVIFTSGSTGRPKGVLASHRNLAQAWWAWHRAHGGHPYRWSTLASVAFDVFSADVVRSLGGGGSLVVVDQRDAVGGAALAGVLRRERVQALECPPPVLAGLVRVLADHADPAPLALRLITVASELLPGELLGRAREALPDTRIGVAFGLTETSVDSTWWDTAGWPAGPGLLPIGHPLPGSRCHVLDRYGHPAPVGVPGELYAGGDGVTYGYLGRPDLTAERFVADPFAADGSRLYRTGDRVRRLPDRMLDFLGRLDEQVSLRGHRVEPGEVEAALATHPAVAAAAVAVRSDRLVGYLVPAGAEPSTVEASAAERSSAGPSSAEPSSAGPSAAELRAYLADRLPAHLVPAVFVPLPALPRTVTGKLDRRALPEPDAARLDAGTRYVTPRTATEHEVAEIWSALLGVQRAGAYDDFFALGGHSLLVVQLGARIATSFGVDLPIRTLFDTPVLADLATRVDTALAARDTAGPTAPPVLPVPRTGEDLPVSFAQRRLWFLHELEPDSVEYNVPAAIRLAGPLDVAALGGALDRLVARHEGLRTTFHSVDGVPVQRVHPPRPVPLPVLDLAAETNVEATAGQLVARAAATPFELSAGPLLRAQLIRLAPADHVLVLTMHHIVCDQWSAQLLRDEVTEAYQALHRRAEPALPDLPVQYADFAVWQRDRLREEVLDRQLDHWRTRLAGLAALDLPTDRPRPPVRTGEAALLRFTVPAETLAGLRRVAQERGVTMFMVLLAALKALLARYSGQRDFAVGTLVAGRSRPEVEHLIGFFVNALVMRTDLSGDPTFTELLGRVRDTALDAYAHADLPFERLVEELSTERDRGRSPLFQVVLEFEPARPGAGDATGQLAGLSACAFPTEHASSPFDLTVSLTETAAGLDGGIDYARELFDRTTVERLAGHLRVLLAAVAAAPERRLSTLPLLPPAERRAVLTDWNDTAVPLVADRVPAMVAGRVAATPDAVAVVAGPVRLSYAELSARAARLAHRLRGLGVGPDDVVGVCLPRGADLVVALLGIWQAGGAYLPLDVDYPAERLSFMVRDAAVSIVVTDLDRADRLPASVPIVLCLDDPGLDDPGLDDPADAAVLAGLPAEPPAPARADSLAYVTYTSGSRGRPKGVMISHRNVMRLVCGGFLPLDRPPVVLQLAPVSFDASTFEIWLPLAHGGTCVLFPPDPVPAPERIGEVLREHRVDTVWLTTSLFNTVLDAAPDALRGVRHVLAGGEALSVPHIARALDLLPDTTLVNGYGPTECTTFACCHPIRTATGVRSIPIGTPIGNTTCYVLDETGQPAPVGVPGELLLGGLGVGRGYLGRPELTAERFVADPYVADGSRLYRTGDRARWRADATLEYLGRFDDQVKVRGFRIEPAEVETALLRHPGVRQAAVTVREQRLVGYLVLSLPDDPPASDELRDFLAQELPEHMVPSVFVVLDELPRNPNGKLDRAALPEPDAGRPYLATPLRPPATPTERALASIWAELLDVSEVGADDEFFALGGHSLLATRVIARVRETLGVPASLGDLFEHPVLSDLAAALDAAVSTVDGAAVPPLRPVPRTGDGLPLSYGQQRLWFLHQLEPGSVEYNVPAALRLRGEVEVAALRAALSALVARHEVLRTRFAAVDGVPVQVIDPPAMIDLPVVDVTDRGPEAFAAALEVARQSAGRPFDLATGPVLRAVLVRAAADDHLLALTLHHIVSDLVSVNVLTRDLGALYEAARTRPATAGDPVALAATATLPKLPVQYADFAVWQRGWLCGEVLDGQLGYWRDRLAGVSPVELPADRPRPTVRSGAGAMVEFELPADVVSGLHELARAHDATMFMVLLAAYQVLLSRLSGQRDFAVGTPIGGRSEVAVEELIGFFVNTLVLRTDLSGKPSFADVLARARVTVLGAFAHADVPFERLVEELAPERDRTRSPLFQVMFNYVEAVEEPQAAGLTAAGLDVSGFEVSVDVARVDLRLIVSESVGCVSGWLEYSSDLFDVGTVRRWAVGFVGLLRGFVADPGVPVAGVGLVDPGERAVLLSGWGVGESVVVSGSVVDRVLAADPAAVAVAGSSGVVSFGGLVEGSGRLAGFLRGVGVGVESVVGVAVPPGPDLVVALVGVWRAGGAFVVVDAGDGLERVDAVLSAAGVRVVVCVEALLDVVPAWVSQVVVLDDPGDAAAVAASGVVSTGRVPVGALAYVVATSGSSGVPKLVGVSHGALVDYVLGVVDRLGLVGVRCGFAGSVAVDLGLTMVLGGLVGGGGVWLAGREVASDPAVLAAGLVGVGVWKAVPSLVRVLPVDALPPVVVVGGEASELVWAAGLAGTGRVVVNHYGPAEATIGATTWQVPADAAEGGIFGWPSAADLAGPAEVEATTWPVSADLADPVGATTWQVPAEAVAVGGSTPVGRPLPNARCYVLDEAGQLVPVGVVGELWLGGPGVARGYVGRPDLTAERFVADPFAGDGCRLYRTGDRVRWLVGGMLEFLGRVDDQVKVRGFRVEPGEVAAVLRRHPAIGEVVVAGRSDPVGGSRLVGWVVPADPDRSLDPGVVREWVRGRVPEYLVPVVVVVDGLPRLGSGKVDIRSLPDPSITPATSGEAPAGNTERLLALVWGQLLGRGGVDRGADFFDLGGHSLLAIQVVARLRQALGIEVPVRELFDAPTLAGFAAVVDHHLGLGPVHGLGDRIGGVGRSGPLPVSFAQQRLWFLDQLEPDSSEYNVPAALHLAGHLDVDALRSAVALVAGRQESLRTRFVAVDGVPHQVVDPDLRIDLSTVPAESLERARAIAAEVVTRPFDLAAGPLLRAVLIRLGPEEHILLLVTHHIVSDQRSAQILRAELAEAYRATLAGEPPRLADLPVQYADYAVWQRERLSGAALEAHLAYWREQLAGVRPLELPTDGPRPAVRTTTGGWAAVTVPAALADALRRLAGQHGATMYMVLLAAFTALLSRYAGQDDVAVGTPVAGRGRPETADLIGFFVNTVVLCTDTTGDPAFTDLLARVREVALGAYAHAELPFERLVEELAPQRDLSRTPLFQVMFDYAVDDGSPAELTGLASCGLGVLAALARYEVTLSVSDTPDGVVGGFEYNADLFSGSTMARLAERFVRLLAAVAADPGRRLSGLPLLSEADRRELAGWEHGPAVEPGPPALVPDRIAARAAIAPDATALVEGDRRVSYADLDAAANRLAHHLRDRGVRRDGVVAVALPRGVEQVVAALAAWRAGAGYLPLDSEHPAERLGHLLADAGATVLVTHAAALAGLGGPAPVILDDPATAAAVAALPATAPGVPLAPENLAYVIYTSGSTGRPKGVQVSHGALANHTAALAALGELGPGDRFVPTFSFAFDASVEELFPPLVTGGTLVLTPEGLPPVHDLATRARAAGSAFLHLPAAYWEAWLAEAPPSATDLAGPDGGVRFVKIGGESPGPEHLRYWAQRVRIPLWNVYGPTEATITTAVHRLDTESRYEPYVPIGRPLPGVVCRVLDRNGARVPAGVPGELYLGGVQVARGYAGQPDLTAERFVPDPYAADGARLYRTGDLVRRRADGVLEFLGRVDDQVKVRGYRVEPAEVEAAIAAHPAVRAVSVQARAARLVGYVVGHGPGQVDLAGIRDWLRHRLPAHLVPSALVRLDALPLNANGKVDRAALPEPGAGEDYEPPASTTEQVLADVWADLLGHDRLGAQDDFFALGGHSLLATQLLARVRSAFAVDLPLRTVFEAPSLRAFASAVDRSRAGRPDGAGGADETLVRMTRDTGGPAFFCVHAVSGSTFCYRPLATGLAPEVTFVGLQSVGLDHDRVPLDSVAELAARYVRGIRQARPDGPYRIGGWSMGTVVALEIARQLADAGQEPDLLCLIGLPTIRRFRTKRLLEPVRRLDALADQVRTRPIAEVDRAELMELAEPLVCEPQFAIPPERWDAAALARRMKVIAANQAAQLRYRPGPYAGRVLVVMPDGDRQRRSALSQWSKVLTGDVTVRTVPGDHHSVVMAAENAARLASVLGPWLVDPTNTSNKEERGMA